MYLGAGQRRDRKIHDVLTHAALASRQESRWQQLTIAATSAKLPSQMISSHVSLNCEGPIWDVDRFAPNVVRWRLRRGSFAGVARLPATCCAAQRSARDADIRGQSWRPMRQSGHR